MAPAAQRDRADTYLAMKSRSGIQKVTVAFSVRDIMVGVTFSHFPQE